jgi:hypothetical protein
MEHSEHGESLKSRFTSTSAFFADTPLIWSFSAIWRHATLLPEVTEKNLQTVTVPTNAQFYYYVLHS